MSDDKLRKALLGIPNQNLEATRKRSMPPGWTPGLTWDQRTSKGEITTDGLEAAPQDWGPLLEARGLDPNIYEVNGDTVRWCSWDGWKRNPDEEGGGAYSAICYSFKAEIRLKHEHKNGIDAEELLKEIRKTKPHKTKKSVGEATLVVPLADWQCGNGDGGGVETQIAAIGALPELILDRASDLKKMGYPIGHIVLAGMGDLMENCSGFYSSQSFSVELDHREQTRVVRRGLTEIFKTVAPRFEKVTGVAIAGNHGQRRMNGKPITGPNDNDDVAVFEQVAEIFAANPEAYGNIEFRIPAERLAISLNLHGIIVGFTHGHLSRGSSEAIKVVWDWWKGQAHGRWYPGVADADILVVGHYHHLNVKEQANRTLMVGPSLTRVSDYFSDGTGYSTVPGTLSFVVTEEGWDELKVLR